MSVQQNPAQPPHLLLSALVVGSLMLLGPYQAPATPLATLGLTNASPVSYAQVVDNPAEPGDAFPTGPFAGGTG
jgi:hypothetical protein